MRILSDETKRKNLERAKAWNLANKERQAENQRRWTSTNPEKAINQSRKHYARNKAICDARTKAFEAKNPWYRAWQSAKQRCENPKGAGFKWYGGRGIKFRLSKEDVSFLWDRDAAQYQSSPSLDRINSHDDYSLENCRFIEKSENCRRARVDCIMAISVARSLNLVLLEIGRPDLVRVA